MNAKKIISLLCVLSLQLNAFAQDRLTGKPFATRSEVIARNGMAATSQPLATQVAIEILKQGGSAVDAAIAANATLGLVEPVSNGIGGDLYAIVWDAKTQKLHGLNASGRSPYSLTLDYFKSKGLKFIPTRGALPVSARPRSIWGRSPASQFRSKHGLARTRLLWELKGSGSTS